MANIELRILPIFNSVIPLETDDFYVASWITQPKGKNEFKQIPSLNMKSNSSFFVSGFVSDLHVVKNEGILKYAIIEEEISVNVQNFDEDFVRNISPCSTRLCFTLYKKTEVHLSNKADASSSKLWSSSFDFTFVLHNVLAIKKQYRSGSFVASFPMIDYCTFVSLDNPLDEKLYSIGKVHLLCSFFEKDSKIDGFHKDIKSITSYIPVNEYIQEDEKRISLITGNAKSKFVKLVYFCIEMIPKNFTTVDEYLSQRESPYNQMLKILEQNNFITLSGNHLNEDSIRSLYNDLYIISNEMVMEWLRLETHTKSYIKQFNSLFDENFNFRSKNGFVFSPDIKGLKGFKRIYWIIDNVKVPYPHFTKLCLPKLIPISVDKLDGVSLKEHVYPFTNISQTNETTEIWLQNILSLSCMKYGLENSTQFMHIVSEAFILDFDKDDVLASAKLVYTVEKEYLKKNSVQNYMLLKCIEIAGDFLCYISCSMNYRFDTRIKNIHKKQGYQDVDSVDFDSLSGLNEEGDCDETGLFIDYVFCILCNGKSSSSSSSRCWKAPELRALTFVLLQYVDYCTFGAVDEAKMGGNGTRKEYSSDDEDFDEDNQVDSSVEKNPDLLYNTYDKSHSCSTGHTFVILVPFSDLNALLTSEKFPKSLLQIDEVLLKRALSQRMKEIYGYIESLSDEASDYLSELVKKLPRLILEGTARQNALSLHNEIYYGNGEYNVLSSYRPNMLNTLSASFLKHVEKNSVLNNTKGFRGLSSMDYCEYQKCKFYKETKLHNYDKRCVDFYRRLTQSTSQMLRYIFRNDLFPDHREKNIEGIWDNFIWVDINRKKWGSPLRHVLECNGATNMNGIVAIPTGGIKLSDTYSFNNNNIESQSKKWTWDVFVSKNLGQRLPHSNFYDFKTYDYLESSWHHFVVTNLYNVNATTKPKNSTYLEIDDMLVVSESLKYTKEMKHRIVPSCAVYFVSKLDTKVKNTNTVAQIKSELKSTIEKMLVTINNKLDKVGQVNLNGKMVTFRSLPWFRPETFVIFSLIKM